MATGEVRGAFSLSEPDAGSDTKALRCKATPDGDTYVIDGTKMWVTNGERAGIVALAARTPEGITCFIVEKEPGPAFEGISVSREHRQARLQGRSRRSRWSTTAIASRPPTCWGATSGSGRGLQLILELARAGPGQRGLARGRRGPGRVRGVDHVRPAARDLRRAHRSHQAIQFKLADMATKLEAARLLVHNAARKIDNGERADVEAGMAKLFASETAFEVATEAMRIHGGYGYTTELPIERYYRDAPLMIIGEGTNEIQRMVIARGLLSRYAEG